MAEEHILIPQQIEQRIEHTIPAAERPAPTVEDERLADTVFTREQGHLAAAILGVQAGVAIMHHLAVETFTRDKEEEEEQPKREPHPRKEM
jgi:hypothetical protein